MASIEELTQAASAVARAIPTWPTKRDRMRLPVTLTTTEMIAKFIGVRVSSRAKKPGENTLLRVNAGRPIENAARAVAVATVSLFVNAPCSKQVFTMASGNAMSATVAGSVKNIENSSARFWFE